MTYNTVRLLKAGHPAQPVVFPCSEETNALEMDWELHSPSGVGEIALVPVSSGSKSHHSDLIES